MSDNNTQNVPEIIRQEAKERALKIIEANQGCISCVRPEDLNTQSLFIPVVSVIKPTPEDFYDPIPEVGIMMKPPLTNKIREMAGIEILRTETEKRGEYIWHAHVFGQKRQPDGTMLKDDASYEFDAEKRSEMDVLGNPKKYATDIDKRMHLLKVAKFGDQRSVTGAQHALIHKLAKIPRSFKSAQELMRGMIVCRVDRNVNGILQDPGMRQAVIEHALGATEAVFGPPSKQIEAQSESAPERKLTAEEVQTGEVTEIEPVENGQKDMFKDDIPWDEDPKDIARRGLRNFLALNDPNLLKTKGWGTARQVIKEMIDNKDATLEAMKNLIKKSEEWLTKCGYALPTAQGKEGAA